MPIWKDVLWYGIQKNDTSVKNGTQSKSSQYFPDHSIDLEVTNLMSSFYNKSLKKVTLVSTTTHECSNSSYV